MLGPKAPSDQSRRPLQPAYRNEIKRDYEIICSAMWETIRELTLKSIAPAKIYEEGGF